MLNGKRGSVVSEKKEISMYSIFLTVLAVDICLIVQCSHVKMQGCESVGSSKQVCLIE